MKTVTGWACGIALIGAFALVMKWNVEIMQTTGVNYAALLSALHPLEGN